MTTQLGHFAGMRIIYDKHMVNTVEDWSRVRSPARAQRRRKRGFRQNIDYREVPKPDAYRVGDTLIMHPETAKVLMARAALTPKDRTMTHISPEGRE